MLEQELIEVEPSRICQLDVKQHALNKPSSGHTLFSPLKESFDPCTNTNRDDLCERSQSLFEKVLDMCPSAVVLTCIPLPKKYQSPPSLPDVAEKVLSENPDLTDEELINEFNIQLSFNDSQLNELEKTTRQQAASKVWVHQRIGCITGTKMRDVYTKVNSISKSKAKQKVSPLLAKMFKEKDIKGQSAVTWGRENEDRARSSFLLKIVNCHKNGKLHSSGLITSKSFPFIRASPDDIFSCKCCPDSPFTVEYKCPYSIRNKSVKDAWQETDFLENRNGTINLKRNHKYYTQITGQMALKGCERSFFCYLDTY